MRSFIPAVMRWALTAVFSLIAFDASAKTLREAPPPVVIPPPIVSAPVSGEGRYENWTYTTGKDYSSAYTANESGSVFGLMCGKQCVYYINVQISCVNDNSSYPAMLNALSGAAAVTLKCYNLDSHYILTFSDDISNMIKSGGEIGFAVPLESGKFAVSRFSLTGALIAMRAAIDRADAMQQKSQNGVRDFKL